MLRALRSLNHLAAASENSGHAQGHDRLPRAGLAPTAVQRWMVDSVQRRVEAYGDCPADLTEESSLREILEVRDLYSFEPKNIAKYDFDKVKILHREVSVRPIRGELPPSAAGYITHYRDLIERNEAEIEKDRDEGRVATPHWDLRLKSSRALRFQLYRRLHRQGLLSFRRKVKCLAGLFEVRKKDRMQRLIVDARGACASHRAPPTTRLGSTRCMADLDLSDPRLRAAGFGELGGVAPFGLEGDVGDCFYNYSIPELASWFGLNDRTKVSDLIADGFDLNEIYDEDIGGMTPLDPQEYVYPVMEAVCMGWSWALFFANEAVAYRVSQTAGTDIASEMRERKPTPCLMPGRCATGTYVDNVQVVGGTRDDCEKRMKLIKESFVAGHIPFEVSAPNNEELQTLGLVYH